MNWDLDINSFVLLQMSIFHQQLPGLPGSIHEDTVMDGHRQGKEANAYKYPLTFLKWWSSLILNTFNVSAETIPSPNLFHSSHTLLANLNFPTSNRYLFLNSLKLCPLPSSIPNHLEKSIRFQLIKPSQYLEDLNQVRPQESCLKSSESQDPQSVPITITLQTLHHPGRSPLNLLQHVYILPVVRSPCLQ